ncbi:aminotransferase class I/II-fold pyridoxal phosphate-dependent enzyme [Alkalibacterium sp. 20]|uniref:aminotransferase class I/II-fold pyridoxal phosphate-dependent enzyme n=1 Tax=Alkalibacterium sp. 20 TaxID=1798803 RepID=UPI0009F80A6F|nr:aminotransferase class I/II-fold pyridoxal phosphate-dependent enzyme [Alkalibacterium sp. 20]
MNQRILLSTPHMSGNEKKYIDEAFESNWIAPLGPNVDSFEKEIATYNGVKGASVTSSGTAAIHLALALLGVCKDDAVFVSSFTFVASANPVLYLGAEPVFIDSEEDTWNMSPEALEVALAEAKSSNRMPKAIVVVNLYGQSAKMKELTDIAQAYNVPIVEDAAESLGSTYKNKKSGTFGTIGIYSFNGNKIITTSGGGALVSDDDELLVRAKFLATQAKDDAPYYQHSQVGYNYRMSNVVAGIGRAQLEVLDERVNKRREVFSIYQQELGGIQGVQFMPEMNETKSNRWLTTLTLDWEKYNILPQEFISKMDAVGIETRLLWKPLHLQPLFADSKFYKDPHSQIPVSEKLFDAGLCLPSGTNMAEFDQLRVITEMKKILNSSRKHVHVFSWNKKIGSNSKLKHKIN